MAASNGKLTTKDDIQNRLFALLVMAVMAFGAGNSVATAAEGPRVPQREYVMNEDRFARLLQLIDEESFDSGKLRVIEAASLGGYFSCRQVALILKKISFSSEKKKVIEIMANSIVGFRGIDMLLDQFSFDSEKKEVLDLLGMPYFRF